MRVGMGLIKNEHGVFHVRRKVPKALEVATATAMGVPKERVSWLKETLGTKDEKKAKVLAKPVMMKFDRIFAQAEALLAEHPVRTELTEAEIKQVADYFYALQLNGDEELRVGGVGDDPLFASIHQQLSAAGVEFETPFSIEKVGSGLSDRMMHKIDEGSSIVLPALKEALARGNVEREFRGDTGLVGYFQRGSDGRQVADHAIDRIAAKLNCCGFQNAVAEMQSEFRPSDRNTPKS
jgi:hypothetical protein